LVARLFIALALVAGVAACGGDDEEETGSASGSASAPADETTTTGDGEGEEASGDVEAYCDATLEIETVPEPDIDFESATPEEQAEAVKAYAAEELQPLAQEIEEVAPEEVAADIEVLVAAVDELAETGDFEAAFENPETEEASDNAHAFDLENCGWEQVDVTAVDYAFEGIPETVPAGAVSFEFANEGEEFHELQLARKNDGVTESAEELLQLPEEEAMEKVTILGGTFAPPGESEYVVNDLEAGDYIAVCFIPVGATPENEEGTGPPHFTQGMVAEFTVE
jgi:hypothetical protein